MGQRATPGSNDWRPIACVGGAVSGLIISAVIVEVVVFFSINPSWQNLALLVMVAGLVAAGVVSLAWSIKNDEVLRTDKVRTWEQPLAVVALLLGVVPTLVGSQDPTSPKLGPWEWVCVLGSTGIGLWFWFAWFTANTPATLKRRS